MACTNVPRLLVDRPVAPDSPLPHGLIDTSTVVEDMNPHGIHGLEYVALCDPAVKPYPVGDCPDDARPPKEADRSQQLVRADAFALYAAEACPATASALASARQDLATRFEAGEQHALEAVIYNGWSGARPFLRDPEADIVVTDPVPLATAIGIAEHRLATLGYPATLHLPRWMASQVPGIVRESGQIITNPDGEDILTSAGLYTRLGSRLVFGSGYDGAPPVGVEDDTNTWIYATTPVTVSRTELIYPADASSGAFDPSTNTTFALVERLYVVDWPCQVVAVPTTVPNPGSLFPLPPLAPQIIVDPLSGPAPLEVSVSVDNHGQGPVTINFGDGSDPVSAADGATLTHTYAANGPYTVTASSNARPLLTASQNIQVTVPTIPPPTNLTATGADSAVAVEWEWGGEENPDAFDVEHRTGGGTWQADPSTTGDARAATITGLEHDTTYEVRVRARVGMFTSPPATAAATTDPAPELAAPENVAAAEVTDTSATITWDWDQGEGPSADGFTVSYTGASTGAVYTEAAARSAPLEGLPPASEYTVTVTAHAGNESASSESATFTTAEPTPLSPPTDLTVSSATFDSLTVTWEWEQGAGPQATGFEFAYRTPPEEGEWVGAPDVNDPAARTTVITGLEAGTAYEIRANATNDDEDSPYATTTGGTVPAPALAAPTAISISNPQPTSAMVGWQWEPQGGPQAESFTIAANGHTVTVDDPEARSSGLSGLEPSTDYELTVTAHAGNESASSDPVPFTTPAAPVAAPTGVAVANPTASSLEVTWEWAEGIGPSATSFTVRHRTPAGSGAWSEPVITPAEARSAGLQDLESDTEYEVEVVAYADAESSQPATATGSTTTEP